jgi:hypothetical protein
MWGADTVNIVPVDKIGKGSPLFEHEEHQGKVSKDSAFYLLIFQERAELRLRFFLFYSSTFIPGCSMDGAP